MYGSDGEMDGYEYLGLHGDTNYQSRWIFHRLFSGTKTIDNKNIQKKKRAVMNEGLPID